MLVGLGLILPQFMLLLMLEDDPQQTWNAEFLEFIFYSDGTVKKTLVDINPYAESEA